jgi:hypothetical protein
MLSIQDREYVVILLEPDNAMSMTQSSRKITGSPVGGRLTLNAASSWTRPDNYFQCLFQRMLGAREVACFYGPVHQ